MSIVPVRKRMARPAIPTRSPRSAHRRLPPRRDSWRASRRVLPSVSAQYGIKVQCAEPVTGSSSRPSPRCEKARDEIDFVANHRLGRSGRGDDDPARSSFASAAKSGVKRRDSGRDRRRPRDNRARRATLVGSCPSAAAKPCGAVHGAGGREGKSSAPAIRRRAIQSDRRLCLCGTRRGRGPAPEREITNAEASVAWPHRSTSTVGVNQRRCPGLAVAHKNAVSDRLFSAAIACMRSSASQSSSGHTAAGLPVNGPRRRRRFGEAGFASFLLPVKSMSETGCDRQSGAAQADDGENIRKSISHWPRRRAHWVGVI